MICIFLGFELVGDMECSTNRHGFMIALFVMCECPLELVKIHSIHAQHSTGVYYIWFETL